MKKKIIFAIVTGFFTVATVFNMNLLQGTNSGDISLDAFVVLAQAGAESGSSNDPVNVGTVYMGNGGAMQYKVNDRYYSYTQSATKYYDPTSGSYFYQANAPVLGMSESQPIPGAIMVSPMPTGFTFSH